MQVEPPCHAQADTGHRRWASVCACGRNVIDIAHSKFRPSKISENSLLGSLRLIDPSKNGGNRSGATPVRGRL